MFVNVYALQFFVLGSALTCILDAINFICGTKSSSTSEHDFLTNRGSASSICFAIVAILCLQVSALGNAMPSPSCIDDLAT